MAYKKETSRSRTPLAITLIVASFLSAFFLATFSNQGSDFWVATVDMVPGHQILVGEVGLHRFDLDSSASLYLVKTDNPVGLITKMGVTAGEILSNQSVSSTSNFINTNAVPVSIRNVDLAAGIEIGDEVDIYWVVDSQNGEVPVDPILILGGVRLLNMDHKSNNFGTDAALTIAVQESQVLRLLSATTYGRFVVVGSNV